MPRDYERVVANLREKADAEALALGCGGAASFHTEGPLLEAPSSTGGKCWYAVGYVNGRDGLVIALHGSTEAVAQGRGIVVGSTIRCQPAEVGPMVTRMTSQKQAQAGKGYQPVLPTKQSSEAEFFALSPAGAMVGAPLPPGVEPYPLDGIPLPDDPAIVQRRVEQAVEIAWQYGDRFSSGRPFQQGLVVFTPRDGCAQWHAVLGQHKCACDLRPAGQVTVQYIGIVAAPAVRQAVDVGGIRFTPYGRGDGDIYGYEFVDERRWRWTVERIVLRPHLGGESYWNALVEIDCTSQVATLTSQVGDKKDVLYDVPQDGNEDPPRGLLAAVAGLIAQGYDPWGEKPTPEPVEVAPGGPGAKSPVRGDAKGPPFDMPCPTCGARAGAWCKRPSGHSGPFVTPHAARVRSSQEAGGVAGSTPSPSPMAQDSVTSCSARQLGFGW